MRRIQSTLGLDEGTCKRLEELKMTYRLSKSEIVNRLIRYVGRGKTRKEKVLGNVLK